MQAAVSSRIHSLYSGYRRSVLKRARQLLRNEDAAQDATQEVFLRLLDVNERVLHHPEPLAWLYRVTTNLCLNRLRDEKRRTKLIARNPRLEDRRAADAEERVIVAQIMGRISPELQEIAVCYHADGMTCHEIAAMLGVSRRTIGNRLVDFQSEAMGTVGNA